MKHISSNLLLFIILIISLGCTQNKLSQSVAMKESAKSPTGLFPQDEFILWYETINDTVEAPTVLFIPKGYDSDKPTPLVVSLHGLVGVDYFRPNPLEDAKHNWCLKEARNRNWLMLVPYSNIDCMWWDKSGMENIRRQIRTVKSKYNVADNQVYVTGFSDGASGSFHLALKMPDIFAGFYPLNGMLNVGSFVSGVPVAIKNLQNRYTYVINTDKDGLYPASETRKLIALALDSNANLSYKEYFGIGHDFAYADKEIPLIFQSMANTRRDPFQSSIYWEANNPDYGKCDWIEIVELDTTEIQQNWHSEPNILLEDQRMSFGFYNNREYPEAGVQVTSVLPNSSVDIAGLLKGDVIIAMDNIYIKNIDQLINLRNKKKRGDTYKLTIARGREQIELDAQFLPPQSYDALIYNKPSGAVNAKYYGNIFQVDTSRVGKLKIYIHPNMVNLENPVKIIINNELYYEDYVSKDSTFYENNLRITQDKTADWINVLQFEIK